MRVTGYIPCLYGAEFMRECVGALSPHVDRLLILYTPEPSFGHHGDLPCPDSEEQLRACCDGFKVEWHRGQWHSEGAHRNAALELAGDVDLIVSADTDEVWDSVSLFDCIRTAYDRPEGRYLINGFHHFWRSFTRVCRDVWAPVRIIKPGGVGDATIDGTVWHFGYAQAEKTVEFKLSCHGHKSEFRPEWWQDIFLANRKNDVHPVVKDWWHPVDFDANLLPLSLKAHANFGKEIIQ